jgi:hypothetical protein
MNSTQLSGIAAECKMQRLIKAAACKPQTISTQSVLQVLESSPLGRTRLRLAERYLLLEYGMEGPDGITLDFNSLPSGILLDYALCTDHLFMHKGYVFAVDVTTDVSKVPEKMEKAESVFPLLQSLGVDFHLTILVEDKFTSDDLREQLSKVIKQHSRKGIQVTSITLP